MKNQNIAYNDGFISDTGRDHQAMLSAMIENSAQMSLAADSRGRILYANPYTHRFLNISEYDIFTLKLEDIFELDKKQLARVDRYARLNRPCVLEAPARRRNSPAAVMLISISPLETNEIIKGLLVHATDISERKRIEDEVVRSRKLLEDVIGTIDDPVFIKDDQLRWVLLNDPACRILGRPREELLGKTVYDLFPEDQADRLAEADRKVISTGRSSLDTNDLSPGKHRLTLTTRKTRIRETDTGRDFIAGIGTELTALANPEALLRQADLDKATILNSTNEKIAYYDNNLKIIWTNRASAEAYGYTSRQLTGKYCYKILRGRSQPCEDCPTREALISGKPEEAEVATPDGRLWYVRAYPVVNRKRKVTGVVEFCRDISSRKKAEAELLAQEERLRYIIRHSPGAIAVFDTDLNFIFASDHYMADHRLGRGNIIGRHLYDAIPETPRRWRDAYQRCLRGTVEKSDDDYYIHADGSIAYTRWECHPWYKSGGDIGGIVLYTEITTEKKLAEQALKISEERFRTVFLTSPDAISISRMDDGTYVDVNHSFTRLTGYTRENIINKAAMDVNIWNNPSDRSRMVAGLLQHGYIHNLKAEFRMKDGRVKTALLSARIITLNATPHVLAITRDIEDLLASEEARLESDRRLATLMSNLPGMAYRCRNDRNWTMEFVSDGALSLTGYEAGALIGNRGISYNELIHPDDREKIWKEVQSAIKVGRPFELIYRINTRDGQERWVWERGRGVYSDAGQLLALEGFINDITESRRAVQAMRESERRYRSLAGNFPNGFVLLFDRDFRFILADGTGFKAAGLSRKQLLNQTVTEAFDAGVARVLKTKMRLALGDRSTYFKMTVNRLLLEFHIRPIKDKEDRIETGIIMTQDITDRARAQHALRESRREKEIILDSLVEHLLYLDIDRKILWANRAACEAAGLSRVDMIGRRCHEVRNERRDTCPDCPVTPALLDGKLHEVERHTPDGRHWHVRGYPVTDSRGEITGAVEIALDITKRKKAEKNLLMMQSTVDCATDGVFWARIDGSFAYVNDQTCKHLGYTREQLLTMTLMDVEPEVTPESYAKLWEDVKKAKTRLVNLQAATGSSRPFPAEMKLHHVDFFGREYMFGLVRDISRRKKAQEELRRSEEKYRLLVENQTDMIVKIDLEGRIQFASPSCCNILGKTPEELTGSKFHPFVHKDDMRDVKEALNAIKEPPHASYIEGRCLTKSGWRWTGWKYKALHDQEGKTASIMAVGRDITDRQLAEEMLRETNSQFETLIHSIPDIVYFKDCEGHNLIINKAFEKLTGLESEAIIGRTDDELFPPDLADKCRASDEEIKKKGVPVHFEEEMTDRDGVKVYFETVKAPMYDDQGKMLGLIGVSRDITKRKEAESGLKRTTEELLAERAALSEKNIALRQILAHLEKEKRDYQHQVCHDLERALGNDIKRLKNTSDPELIEEILALETSLKTILTRDIDDFRERYARLTPREMQLCDFIRQGLSSKEISERLNLSLVTVHKHREQVRKKLNLTNQRVNLSTYLQIHLRGSNYALYT